MIFINLAINNLIHRIIWVLTESGNLFGLTFDKGQEVIAWHKHNIGAKIRQQTKQTYQ
jgi:hypothetical protein